MRAAIIGLMVMNVIAAVVTVADKRLARRGGRRVPERVLWTLALIGGAVGMYTAMRAVRHKTQHRSFMVGLPTVMVLQVVFAWLLHNPTFVSEILKNFLH